MQKAAFGEELSTKMNSRTTLSDPLPGLKKNDLLLSTGIRLTFGKGAF
ncbi:MAG TPA: hypothetical protein VIW93_01185 [Candidatus Acidoferrum sp.]